MDPSGSVGATDASFLASAFSEFIAASATLETSYHRLQMEVACLNQELAEKNATLKASLVENQRVHSALEQIVNSMPCGILVVEWDGTISMMNTEAGNVLGVQGLSGLNLEVISTHSGLDLSGFLRRRRSSEDQQEFCTITKNQRRWISVHDRSLSNSEAYAAEAQQTILILRDITASKQVEFDREQMRQAVALSEVATTLAHEIRNPLASLELFAELIEGGGGETSQWIAHLRAGIRCLGGVVNNVLSLRGAGMPALDQLNLTEAIRGSVEFVRPISDEAGISLVFTAEIEGLDVRANADALRQVVLNMIRNSIRHTKAGGRITVTVRAIPRNGQGVSRRAVVEFIDTGSGIAEEDIAEIFRPGFSGDGNGSGLGLAVCRKIAQQHAGEIQVKSKVGEGTTFYMEIPTL